MNGGTSINWRSGYRTWNGTAMKIQGTANRVRPTYKTPEYRSSTNNIQSIGLINAQIILICGCDIR